MLMTYHKILICTRWEKMGWKQNNPPLEMQLPPTRVYPPLEIYKSFTPHRGNAFKNWPTPRLEIGGGRNYDKGNNVR